MDGCKQRSPPSVFYTYWILATFCGVLSPRQYDVTYMLWDKLDFCWTHLNLIEFEKGQVQVFEVDITWLLESGVDWHLAHSSAGILWLSIVSEMRPWYGVRSTKSVENGSLNRIIQNPNFNVECLTVP